MINTLAKSFTVSDFPVPAGPAGEPPRWRLRAPVKVRKHRSVRGVTTRREAHPIYSHPYANLASACTTRHMFVMSCHSYKSCLKLISKLFDVSATHFNAFLLSKCLLVRSRIKLAYSNEVTISKFSLDKNNFGDN